jgi:hypothetical protein
MFTCYFPGRDGAALLSGMVYRPHRPLAKRQ